MSIGNYTITHIGEEDGDWIASCLNELREYLGKKNGQPLTDIPDPKLLDETFDSAKNELDGETMTSLFGCGFGNYFVQEAGFEWVLFSDEYGTDLAVHHPETKVSGFPLSSVSKRLNDPTAGRFDAIFVTLTGA